MVRLATALPSITVIAVSVHSGGSSMAEIVAGFGVPHTPMFPALVAREGPESETAQLYRSVADHLRAVEPEVLVIFDSDHLNTFFLDNFPTLSVGLSDHT